MKIVEPDVTLVHATSNPERVIERMGRICYQSNHKVLPCEHCIGTPHSLIARRSFRCDACDGTGTDIASAIVFVNMIKANGHESVLEHASAGFSIVTDRGVTHEIVRHRLASYSQESTRYCNYGKAGFGGEISVIEPRGALRENTEQREVWVQAICAAERGYLSMLENGTSPQIARSVLPNSLKSEIGMTANFREWRHFLRLRTSPKAHPQMREIAEMLRRQLLAISKVCFEDIP